MEATGTNSEVTCFEFTPYIRIGLLLITHLCLVHNQDDYMQRIKYTSVREKQDLDANPSVPICTVLFTFTYSTSVG